MKFEVHVTNFVLLHSKDVIFYSVNNDDVTILQKAVVQEWLGEAWREHWEYQSFLNKHRHFLTGSFTGDIGDLVVRALTNMLKGSLSWRISSRLCLLLVAIADTQPVHIAFSALALATTILFGGRSKLP